MTTPCRVAIIGAGAMAREHIRAFADLPGVTLAGIHSRTTEKAEALAAEFGIAGVYPSVEELYTATEARLVVVAVNIPAMLPIALECLHYPWALLLEKPPGLDLDEANTLHAASEAAGRRVLVGLNRRFLGASQAAYDDLQKLDAPRFIHVQDQQNMAAAQAYGHPPAVVANWPYANSIHLVDYLRHFGRGTVTRVSPLTPWQPGKTAVHLAKVEFSSGDVGLYEGIWDGPGPWAVSISTPARRWEMRPLESASYQNAGERGRQEVEASPLDAQFKPGFRLQAAAAVAAALGQPSDCPSLGESLEVMRLIHQIFR